MPEHAGMECQTYLIEEVVGVYFEQEDDNGLETAITMLQDVEQTTEETRSTKNKQQQQQQRRSRHK